MRDSTTQAVFRRMLEEEWRLHSRFFDGSRFFLFPVLVTFLAASTTQLLIITGTDPDTIVGGLFALVLIFGIHTGSVGLVGRDSLNDLLGDLTLLVFSARTLPLSHRDLLGIFVVKDVLYYATLFLAPLSIGLAPAFLVTSGTALVLVVTIGWLLVTLTAIFVLGIGITLAGIGLLGRGRAARLSLFGGITGAIVIWYLSVPLTSITPYGMFLDRSAQSVLGSVGLIAGVFLLAALTFEIDTQRDVTAKVPNFRRWDRYLDDPQTTRTLLELHRSSGGVWKVLLSGVILLVVTVGLVDLAGRITGVTPSVGIAFGAILGLSAFTTYNWLTQFDQIDASLIHAQGIEDVFRGKFRAFILIGPSVGIVLLAIGYLWRGTPLDEGVAGAVILVGISCYIFGVTSRLTGLSPNELLFDAIRFLLFGVLIALPLVPLLLAAFLVPDGGPVLLWGTAAFALLLGVFGIGCYRWAVPHWRSRLRA